MIEKQFYDWQILGDGSEFSQAIEKLGRNLVWFIAQDGDGLIFKSATLEDTLQGKILAWSDPTRRQSKQAKDFTDIVRLVESHPHLWNSLPEILRSQVDSPANA